MPITEEVLQEPVEKIDFLVSNDGNLSITFRLRDGAGSVSYSGKIGKSRWQVAIGLDTKIKQQCKNAHPPLGAAIEAVHQLLGDSIKFEYVSTNGD